MKWWRDQSPVEKALATAVLLLLSITVAIGVGYYCLLRPWLGQ